MAVTFTAGERARIQRVIDLMVKGQAYETPFDSQLIEEVSKALASASSGTVTDGDLREALKLRPFSTLLTAILQAAG